VTEKRDYFTRKDPDDRCCSRDDHLTEGMSQITFYSAAGEDSSIGNSFIDNSLSSSQVLAFPEPESYCSTAALLLTGLGIWAYHSSQSGTPTIIQS